MTRYHVTDDGRVMPCAATQKPCIYLSRDDERHFDNIEDANQKSSEMLAGRYGMFGSVKKTKRRKDLPLGAFDFDVVSHLSLYENRFPNLSENTHGKDDFARSLRVAMA